MGSFVESATLRINDQSSAKLNKLTASLRAMQKAAQSLQRTTGKAFNVRTNTTQIGRAVRDLSRLNAALKNTSKTQISPRVNMAGVGRLSSRLERVQQQIRRINNQSVGPNGGGVGGGRGGNGQGNGNGNNRGGVFGRFPRNIMPILGLSAGYDVANGVRTAARTAGSATLAVQSERSQQQILGWTAQEMMELDKAASDATRGMLNLTKTQALASARNLKTAGTTGDALTQLTRVASQSEAALTPIWGKDAARRITESNIKIADLAGALDDVGKGSRLLEAGAAIQLRGGEDFNFKTFLAAIRTSGAAMSLSAEGMVNFASAVDEQGQRAGSGLARFTKVLTIPLEQAGKGGGVAKGTVKALTDSGIRTGAGANDDRLLREDPGQWIRKNILPVLVKNGVNIDDAPAVQKALTQMGFVGQERKFVEGEIVKRREREADRAQARRVRIDKVTELAQRDLGLALQQLGAQFKDVSSKVLEPVFRGIAPLVSGAAKALDDLEQGNISRRAVVGAAGAAGAAALGFAAANPHIVALGVAGIRLTSAAAALRGAAVSLRGGGGPLGGGGGGRRGRGRGVLRGAGVGIGAGAFALAGMEGGFTSPEAISSAIGTGLLFVGGPLGAAVGTAFLVAAQTGLPKALADAWSNLPPFKSVNELSEQDRQKNRDTVAKNNAAITRLTGVQPGSLNPSIPVNRDMNPTTSLTLPESIRALSEIIGRDAQSRVQAIDAETRAASLYDVEQAERLKAALDQGSATGAEKIQVGLETGATNAGSALAQPLLDAASAIGASIAATMSANFRPAPLTVGPINLPAAAPNTGPNTNVAR